MPRSDFGRILASSNSAVKNRVLIRNLPSSATPEAICALFEVFGYGVESIDLGPNDQWRLPREYAVVTLSPDSDVRKAIREIDGKEFQGRTLVVNGVKPLKWRYRSERAA